MAQIYPGTSQVAQNRRNFTDPEYELEKLREISDEDVVKILGHRAPGEEYKSVHPPLDEMDEPDDIVTGVIRGQTISQDKLDEIIRKVKLALGDA